MFKRLKCKKVPPPTIFPRSPSVAAGGALRIDLSLLTMKRVLLFTLTFLLFAPLDPLAGESDLGILSELRREETHNSELAQVLIHLTDVNGPRLTGSPGFQRAAEWTRDKLTEWGMDDARLEEWGEFGRGWDFQKCRVEMTEPYYFPLIAYPEAWTASLEAPAEGTPIVVRIGEEKDFADYRGKLSGAIVLLARRARSSSGYERDEGRYTDAQLEELTHVSLPSRENSRARRSRYRALREFAGKIRAFLLEEGVRVVLEQSGGDNGTVFVSSGGPEELGEPMGLPAAVIASEQFGRMVRMLDAGAPLEVRVELQSRTYEGKPQGFNVLAELPGTDSSLSSQIVMLGAHLDSWHAGTGATDDAAGCAVVMEAARLLKVLEIRLRRTLRIALWSGEEQGLLGSRAYVKNHFADPESGRTLPEYVTLDAYYNLDNGSGKIRGVYLQGNDAVRPIFQDFIEPIRDLGVTTLTIRDTGGTDHIPFDAVGLPGFQFIQDPLDYETRTHHSNVDVYEHVSIADLKQAAIVMAWFAYRTAQLDSPLPREQWPVEERGEGESGTRTGGGSR